MHVLDEGKAYSLRRFGIGTAALISLSGCKRAVRNSASVYVKMLASASAATLVRERRRHSNNALFHNRTSS